MPSVRDRTADWVINSDPYGYSPHDDHAKYQDPNPQMAKTSRASYDTDDSDTEYHRRRSHSPSRSRRSSRTSYNDHDDYGRKADHHDRHHSPQQDARSRRSSRMRGDARSRGHDDSDWDTDYDPRDKYYLSGDEGANWSPTRKYTRDKYIPRNVDEQQRSGHHRASSRDDHSRQTQGRRPLPRRESSQRTVRPHSSSRSSRPKVATRNSSYKGRPRSARYPPNSSKSKHASRGLKKALGDEEEAGENAGAWETALRSGMKAGAIAAIRVSSQKGSIYEKVPRVATAAIGAAVVDSFLTARHPSAKGGTRHTVIRQVTELAIGNLVAKPAAKGVKQRRRGQ